MIGAFPPAEGEPGYVDWWVIKMANDLAWQLDDRVVKLLEDEENQ